MARARRLLMVAFVATALSADRLTIAAPTSSPSVAAAARNLAGRLVVTFRRAVPTVRIYATRREERAIPGPCLCFARPAPIIHPHESFPFRYRLPPPPV